jgi:anti-sigma factor RsiW
MSGGGENFSRGARCSEIEPLLVFYACDEVNDTERQQIAEHIAGCTCCAAKLAEERQLWEAVGAVREHNGDVDPADVMLSQCRSMLSEKLDDLTAPPPTHQEHWRPFGWLRQWMALRPAWAGALLVFFGVLLGAEVIPWLQSAVPGGANGRAVNVLASQKLTDDQLSKMAVAGINLSPYPNAAPGTVQLQLRAEQPMVLSGNVDDSNVRRVLTYVVENERFDAGVRLDCLDALKLQARNDQVLKALLTAARKDQNPAVRMKALEALRDSSADERVRDAMMDALKHDANPGVRVEVVNMLVHSLGQEMQFTMNSDMPNVTPLPNSENEIGDDRQFSSSEDAKGATTASITVASDDPSAAKVIRALEDLQHNDPSRYVRLRSAAALRQIGPRDQQ